MFSRLALAAGRFDSDGLIPDLLIPDLARAPPLENP